MSFDFVNLGINRAILFLQWIIELAQNFTITHKSEIPIFDMFHANFITQQQNQSLETLPKSYF